MRNYNEANQDVANARLSEKIMGLLAPSGFQSHAKYGEVAIRNAGLSKKECMDLTYLLLVEVAKDKVQLLKNVRKETDDIERKIKAKMLAIEEHRSEYGSKLWMWLSGKLWIYEELNKDLHILLGRQDEIRNCRTAIYLVGPQIQKEIIDKYNL